jgi:hypothetical protein
MASGVSAGGSTAANGPAGVRRSWVWISSRSAPVRFASISIARSFWLASRNERYA